ncbi:uncharacterized protein LOC141910382 [Tubulanus polymorphus]|uniref:uncharacterized protein LOC141910382 n=1 Tax=Tubulanus polymorphus TaxID=672921 RepID=UPI003DA3DFD8
MSITNSTVVESARFWIGRVVPPIFIIIGLIGNALAMLILSQSHYRRNTTCLYMRVTSIVDTAYLIGRCLQRYLFTMIPAILSSPQIKKPLCLEYFFVYTTADDISCVLLLAMTVERSLVLAFPFKSKQLSTMRRAWVTIITIVLIVVLLSAFNFIRSRHDKYRVWTCPYHFHNGFDVVYDTVHAIIPTGVAFLLIALNAFIIVTVTRSSKADVGKQVQAAESTSSASHITRSLVVLTTSYCLFRFPLTLYKIMYSMQSYKAGSGLTDSEHSLIFDVTVYCRYGYFVFNSYMYILSCAKFRKELGIFFAGGRYLVCLR